MYSKNVISFETTIRLYIIIYLGSLPFSRQKKRFVPDLHVIQHMLGTIYTLLMTYYIIISIIIRSGLIWSSAWDACFHLAAHGGHQLTTHSDDSAHTVCQCSLVHLSRWAICPLVKMHRIDITQDRKIVEDKRITRSRCQHHHHVPFYSILYSIRWTARSWKQQSR